MTDEENQVIDWVRTILAFGLFGYMLSLDRDFNPFLYALPGFIAWGMKPSQVPEMIVSALEFWREWKSKK